MLSEQKYLAISPNTVCTNESRSRITLKKYQGSCLYDDVNFSTFPISLIYTVLWQGKSAVPSIGEFASRGRALRVLWKDCASLDTEISITVGVRAWDVVGTTGVLRIVSLLLT
jgi:hypothetical protein